MIKGLPTGVAAPRDRMAEYAALNERFRVVVLGQQPAPKQVPIRQFVQDGRPSGFMQITRKKR